MKLCPYPRYKVSGVQWLGDVPAHWNGRRLRDVAQLINGYPFDSELFGIGEGVPLVRIRDIYSHSTEVTWTADPVQEVRINDGDILVGMDGDFNVAWWRGGSALLNQRVCCLRAKDGSLRQKFLYYCLPYPLKALNDITYSTTVKHLSSIDVSKFRFYLPPWREQIAIEHFLDCKISKLDRLISQKRSLIEKLQEKRTALISQTVTRGLPPEAARAAGLDPHPKLKPSGVGWIGDIPEHWKAGKIRRFARMKTGHTPSRQHPEYWEDCTIPWFTLADVWQLRDQQQDFLGETTEKISELGLQNSAAKLLPAGTVILSRTASVGFSGIMPQPMATSQDFWNWICGKELLPKYLLYVFRAMKEEFNCLIMGSTHQTIYQADAAALSTCLPPISEQQLIVAFLDDETKKIDRMVAAVEAAISRLQEYRAALIAAAVTGKIDLREAGAASEPAELAAAG